MTDDGPDRSCGGERCVDTGELFDHTRKVEQTTAVQSLAALAHPVRLEIFRALVVAGRSGLTPGVMQGGLGIPPATLSFHLKELAHAGLASQERDGRHLIYRAAYERMNALLGYLTENCCQGAPCATDPADAACAC